MHVGYFPSCLCSKYGCLVWVPVRERGYYITCSVKALITCCSAKFVLEISKSHGYTNVIFFINSLKMLYMHTHFDYILAQDSA